MRARGHHVVGLDTEFFADGWLSTLDERRAALHRDVRQVESDVFAGIDAVVHLADLSNDPLGEHNPAVTYKINHHGTVRLAKLAKASGIARFVYSSSCSVYGSETTAIARRPRRSTRSRPTRGAKCSSRTTSRPSPTTISRRRS